MTSTRAMTENDFPALQAAITRDTFHPGEWAVEDFIHDPQSEDSRKRVPKMCTVIEDSQGPIAFVRFMKSLRISCVWNDEKDVHRNARAIVFGVRDAVRLARENGFSELVITTESEKLAQFFERVLGMKRSQQEFLLQI